MSTRSLHASHRAILRPAFTLLAILAPAFGSSPPAFAAPASQPATRESAAAQPPAHNEVIVTANRLDTPAAQLGSSATVITGDEISRRQITYIADALRSVPSVTVARSGGAGQVASVFVRGADSDHTLVLIDGVPANDPSSPNHGFDFSALAADNIDRIEVLRGPQSTLWGSDAIGGVINIITKQGGGKPSAYVFGEAGSFNTYREGAGFSGGDRHLNYSLSLSQLNSQSFSAADAKLHNPESDGVNELSAAARIGWNITDNFDLTLAVRHFDNLSGIDNGGGPNEDNKHRTLDSHLTSVSLAPHLLLFDGLWEQTWTLSSVNYQRKDNQGNFNTGGRETDIGNTQRFDWQNNIHLFKTATAQDTLTCGLVAQEETFSSNLSTRETADTLAAYVQDSLSLWDRLFLTAGLRSEDNDRTSAYTTYRLTAAYILPWGLIPPGASVSSSPVIDRTRFHASNGTGFKAPSLSDLFGEFGSRSLRPEMSQGWDAGIEQTFLNQRASIDLTWFHNHFRNLVEFNFITDRLDNIDAARTQGVELAAAFKPADRWTLRSSYTYTDTKDLTTDLSLLRRPVHQVGLEFSYRPTDASDITLTGLYVSSRQDIDPVSFNRTKIGGYTLLNLSGSYRITPAITLYGRVENLLNQHYEEVDGFGTASIGFYAGIRFQF